MEKSDRSEKLKVQRAAIMEGRGGVEEIGRVKG